MSGSPRGVSGTEAVPTASKLRFALSSPAAIVAAGNLILAMVGFVTGAAAARLLGPSGRGELAAIQVWPGVLVGIAALGIPDAILAFWSRHPAQFRQRVASFLILMAMSGAAVAVLAYPVISMALANRSPAIQHAARVALLWVLVGGLSALPATVARLEQRWVLWNCLRMLVPGTWLGILVFAASRPIAPAASQLAIWMVEATLVLTGTVVLWLILAVHRHQLFSAEEWRRAIAFGAPVAASSVPQFLNLRLDQLIMASALPLSALGQYSVAVSWAGAGTPLSSALAYVLLPRVARVADTTERATTVRRSLRSSQLICASTALATAIAAPLAVPVIFGASFQKAIGPAVVLSLANGILAYNLSLGECLKAVRAPKDILGAELAGVAVTAGLLALLLPALGIWGAATTSMAAYGVVSWRLQNRLRIALADR